MSTRGEIRISLEEFHRHLVLTHMKDGATAVFDEVKKRGELSGKPLASTLAEWICSKYPQGAYQDDNWFAKEVPLDGCYFAHTDFRLHPVPKNQRFIDFLPTLRQEIESGTFPCSIEIRAPWSGSMAEPLAQERSCNRYYILDGQLLVIRHWYHDVPMVKLFVYRGLKDV
jgi:hypothetical protein